MDHQSYPWEGKTQAVASCPDSQDSRKVVGTKGCRTSYCKVDGHEPIAPLVDGFETARIIIEEDQDREDSKEGNL